MESPGPGKKSTTDIIRKYEKSLTGKIPKNLPLEDLEFAIIDTETTGTDPGRCDLLAFAGVRVRGLTLSVSDLLELVIKKVSIHNNESIPIHGIITEDTSRGMNEKEALINIIEFISGKIIVGFNINFDKRILDRLLKEHTGSRFKNTVIEINDLARRVDKPVNRIYPEQPQSLKDLCSQYNIPLDDHHTAGGDAFASAQLFLKIVSKLKRRGVSTWGQLKK